MYKYSRTSKNVSDAHLPACLPGKQPTLRRTRASKPKQTVFVQITANEYVRQTPNDSQQYPFTMCLQYHFRYCYYSDKFFWLISAFPKSVRRVALWNARFVVV